MFHDIMSVEEWKPEVVRVLEKYSLMFAPPGKPFILASGAESNYYIDCRKATLTSDGLAVITKAFTALIGDPCDSIGGPTIGADPIVAGMLRMGIVDRGFLIRKEVKDHGPPQNLIVGNLNDGDKVTLVEDVATSGGSVLRAAKVVEEAGAEVTMIAVILDRLQGADQTLKDYDFRSLITVEDLNLVPS